MGVPQSVIRLSGNRFRETGSPIEQHPGRGRTATAAKDEFLYFSARRQPTIRAPKFVTALQRKHTITIGRDAM